MIDWTGHIKIIDFGLSKRLASRESLTYSFVGSEGYMAPEVREREPHNYLADIYSIGSLLYEMLHGFPPFTEYDPHSKKFHHSKTNEISIRENLSPEAKSLIFRLLSKAPSNRLPQDTVTRELLNDAWFSPLRKRIQQQAAFDPPFEPDLSINPADLAKNLESFRKILATITGTRLLT